MIMCRLLYSLIGSKCERMPASSPNSGAPALPEPFGTASPPASPNSPHRVPMWAALTGRSKTPDPGLDGEELQPSAPVRPLKVSIGARDDSDQLNWYAVNDDANPAEFRSDDFVGRAVVRVKDFSVGSLKLPLDERSDETDRRIRSM